MSTLRMTRRQALAMAATGAALASTGVAKAAGPVREVESPPDSLGQERPEWGLIAPLQQGSTLGSVRVKAMGGVRAGAVTVVLTAAGGRTYEIDICARDDQDGAPVPPARTARYDIFAVNEGKGNTPTIEEHGLAAMAIAEVIRANEHRVRLDGVLTQRARLARHPNQIQRGL